MRLPNAAHEYRPWRIREIVPDFTLEDVWALPVHVFRSAEAFGDEEERLLELWLSGWSIPNLPTAKGFAETARRAGLERPSMRGVTAEVWPSLRSLRRRALLGLPAAKALRARSFPRSPARGGSFGPPAIRTWARGLWLYEAFTAVRPMPGAARRLAA
jgi:hypothetical protein